MLYETYLHNIDLGIIPKSKTKQAELFRVRNSTITGWHKTKKIPDYVCTIVDLLIVNNNLQIINNELKRKTDNYSIVVEYKNKFLIVDLWHDENKEFIGTVLSKSDKQDLAETICDSMNKTL